MDQCIPPILHPLIQEYVDRVRQALPERVAAFYLEGSIALGEFNPRLSDIDFIAVLKSRAISADFKNILHIHRKIEQKYPWKMSGMYFQTRDLGCIDRTNEPLLKYHDGKVSWADRFELSAVTWWILQHHGITIFGPPAESLNIPVNMDQLLRMQHRNLNTYWAGWMTRPGRILALTSDWGVQWTVLGVSRQFYTIYEHGITSKIKAGKYALSHLPERWHAIIREAIALRGAAKHTYYRSRIKRAFNALHYLREVIKACSEL